ncbi:MAG: type II secretion system F family protein [Planctomycetota bacterium]
MPDFAYTARSLSGQLVEGTVSAGSQREALASLSAKELFPVKVTAADRRSAAAVSEKAISVGSRRVAPVYMQLASLLRSGVPMLRSLEVIRKQASHPGLRAVMEDVEAKVADGQTLADAMARHPKAFPELATSIVRAGGEGGFLEEALEQVATFTDRADELKSKVVGAMVYPVVLVIIGVLVVTGLIIFAVPKIEEMFDSRADLPALTQGLLVLSDIVNGYGLLILLAIAGVLVGVYQWAQTESGKLAVDEAKTRIPLAGPIYLNLAVGRFCRVLGTLLGGGVPIVRSLEIAAGSTGNQVLEGVVAKASDNITSGEPLADPLRASGRFPSDVVEMIAVAEQSNNLEVVLNQVSDSLEKTTWRKIELVVRLVEPLLLVALAAAVLLIALALLLPIIEKSTGA